MSILKLANTIVFNLNYNPNHLPNPKDLAKFHQALGRLVCQAMTNTVDDTTTVVHGHLDLDGKEVVANFYNPVNNAEKVNGQRYYYSTTATKLHEAIVDVACEGGHRITIGAVEHSDGDWSLNS